MMRRMASMKKAARKGFFSNEQSAELSVELAKEYLRQAGVTSPGQLSSDEQVGPIRDVVRSAPKRRGKGSGRGFRGLKRLARK